MRKLFPKITAFLFGIVFLLGGATTVFGADSYFFWYNAKVGVGGNPGTIQVSGPYADSASCSAAQSTRAGNSSFVIASNCHVGVSVMAEQQGAAIQTNANNANANAAQAAANAETDPILLQLKCNPLNGFMGTSGTLAECIPIVIYYGVYKPASWLLAGSGFIFDAMLTLSIDSNFIKQDFVNSTWGVVRDFSNMLFIFILIYTGVQTILGAKDWRGTVLKVIVMALLINFSLFFSQIIIDAGNVLAVGIYSSMGTELPPDKQSFAVVGVPERDISASLAGAFQPQNFLLVSGKVHAMDAIIVFIVATIVSGFAAYIFLKAALLFVRRLVVFWSLMILSPFAFISIALPGKANKFNEWLHELISQAFVVPVFLFFVYIIMKAISAGDGILGGVLKDPPAGGSFDFMYILTPVMIAALLIKALQEALKFAEGMAGSTGEGVSNLVSGAMGLATGGASLVAQKTVGRAARNLTEREGFKAWAAESSVGRLAYDLTDKGANATFDVRNAPFGAGAALGIGKGGAGNFQKTVSEAKATDIAFGKKITTGAGGKAVKAMVDEYKKNEKGEMVKTGKKIEGTAATAYAQQLRSGGIAGSIAGGVAGAIAGGIPGAAAGMAAANFRAFTGANIGRGQAADEIDKNEKKRISLDEKEKAITDSFKTTLKIPHDMELDSPEAKKAKEVALKELEDKLAKAEAQLEYVKTKHPDDTDMHAMAIVEKRRAEKALKKFESAEADIEKIQEKKKQLGEDKGGKKDKDSAPKDASAAKH
ncbi:MAG: hypothetical protein WC791_01715 [Candidatus Paceibacterota bacterium]|jgi:hypothetical protein